MAVSKIRVTVPLTVEHAFKRLSDHQNLKNIVDEVTTSERIKKSNLSENPNGLGAIRKVTFDGDLLTEEVVAWLPPEDGKEEVGYDYKVIAGKKVIADHLGVIRIKKESNTTCKVSWDIYLKVPLWATGEIAAFFVCRSMEKEITKSVEKNLK